MEFDPERDIRGVWQCPRCGAAFPATPEWGSIASIAVLGVPTLTWRGGFGSTAARIERRAD